MMHFMGENEVTALYDTLITAWNDHDGTAMAAPFAEDGVVIGFDGSVSSGKQTIDDRHFQTTRPGAMPPR
jgi:uncharacterized protein (TIGR02246 family)